MIEIYQVDAFTEEAFAGNPAAVCLLKKAGDAGWMQQVAAEMNLSETAFVHPAEDGHALRWFTPEREVPLCGHATLASAHALWDSGRAGGDRLRFHTRSNVLTAERVDGRIQLDLPAMPLEESVAPEVLQALDLTPTWSGRTPDRGGGDQDLLLELESEDAVRSVRPDFAALREAAHGGFIVTARAASGAHDFVSRYFAPWYGIDEDPVTGAAHCALVPYWTERLGKEELVGYQASKRGGTVHGRLHGDRALLSGSAVTVLRGELLATGGAS